MPRPVHAGQAFPSSVRSTSMLSTRMFGVSCASRTAAFSAKRRAEVSLRSAESPPSIVTRVVIAKSTVPPFDRWSTNVW